MGELVPRCGAGNLIKIVVQESLKSQVHASWHVESTCHESARSQDQRKYKDMTSQD
jgi:hypothetical protein